RTIVRTLPGEIDARHEHALERREDVVSPPETDPFLVQLGRTCIVAFPALELRGVDERGRLVHDVRGLPADRQRATELRSGIREASGDLVDERLVQQTSGQDRRRVDGFRYLDRSVRVVEGLIELVAEQRGQPHPGQGLSLDLTIPALARQV